MGQRLGELARRFGLELRGDAAAEIEGVCALDPGRPGRLGFLANPRHRRALASTRAAAVLVSRADADGFSGNALIAADPYLSFARIAGLFDPDREFEAGIAPTASVAADARIAASAAIGPQCVVEAGAEIGEAVFLGPGCVVRAGANIGSGTRLEARVYVGRGVRIGRRVRVEPGAVIGGRGFGLARGPNGWETVPQLGTVRIGDDVEIGANTTIDRGAIEDTVIEDGVKLDNQIQVAHNVHIGKHTAIAACTGIAGSTQIGARCMIAGAVGIAGHLKIGDDVVVLGRTTVTKSLTAPGTYASASPVLPARDWRRQVGRLRRLGKLDERIGAIERQLGLSPGMAENDEGDGTDDADQ